MPISYQFHQCYRSILILKFLKSHRLSYKFQYLSFQILFLNHLKALQWDMVKFNDQNLALIRSWWYCYISFYFISWVYTIISFQTFSRILSFHPRKSMSSFIFQQKSGQILSLSHDLVHLYSWPHMNEDQYVLFYLFCFIKGLIIQHIFNFLQILCRLYHRALCKNFRIQEPFFHSSLIHSTIWIHSIHKSMISMF